MASISGTEDPHISIITPTLNDPRRSAWFRDLHQSLQDNRASWEWIVVVDGESACELPAAIVADDRVRPIVLDRHCGAAAARNIGLMHARAPWVTSCDDDDLLTPESLDRRLAAVEDGVDWVGAKLAELFEPSGRVKRWDHPVPCGRLVPGSVWEHWNYPAGDVPLGPTTLLVRRTLLQAVGGWQGLPQAEDLGMAIAVTSRSPGVMLEDVVYLYRKHEGMMRRSAGFDSLESISLAAAYGRGAAMRAMGP